MRWPHRLVLAFLFGLPCIPEGAVSQDFIRRGLYFVAETEGIELWIPGWVNSSDSPRAGMTGEFGIKVMGHFLQMYIVVDSKTLEEFIAERNSKATTTFPNGNLEIIENLEGCRHRTAAAVHTNIDEIAGYDNKDLIIAAADLEGKKTVHFHVISAKGLGKAILPALKWMVSSLRLSGEAGLARRMGPRRLDRKTGFSYRLPSRFQYTADAKSEHLQARDDAVSDRLTIRKVAPETVDALKKQVEEQKGKKSRLHRLPHPEKAAVLMTFHPPDEGEEQGRAEALVTFKDGPTVSVEAAGLATRRHPLLTSVEFTVMALKWVDVEQAKADAAAAAGDLAEAIRRKDTGRIRTLMDALVTGAFLPEVREAVEKALPRLDESEQARAVEALVAGEDTSAIPVLVKLYRTSKFKNRHTMRRTVLKSLRFLRDPTAVRLLLAETQAKETALAATAVYSLGFYQENRADLVRKLVPFYKKAETSGTKSKKLKKRMRWTTLEPAYQKTLQRLTGQKFPTAKEAEYWYRVNKDKL